MGQDILPLTPIIPSATQTDNKDPLRHIVNPNKPLLLQQVKPYSNQPNGCGQLVWC